MNKTNLSAYMAMTVSQLKEEQRMGTAHVYQSTLNRIKDFMEQDSISFEEVTPVWLKAFQEYLLERQLHWNTISTYMRMLRATYFRAVDDGLAPYQPRLFKGVYTGTKVYSGSSMHLWRMRAWSLRACFFYYFLCFVECRL